MNIRSWTRDRLIVGPPAALVFCVALASAALCALGWVVVEYVLPLTDVSRHWGGGAVGLLGALLLVSLARPGRVTFDAPERRYTCRRGVVPWQERLTGTWDDIGGLRVDRRDDSEGGPYWAITLTWRTPGRRPIPLCADSRPAWVRTQAEALARWLGVPLSFSGEWTRQEGRF